MGFKDRIEAGQKLGHALARYISCADGIILALPRGGVPVGAEVAKYLSLPLDVFIVKKLGFLGQEELAMGAVDSAGGVFLNEEISGLVSDAALQFEIEQERQKIKERLKLYKRAPLNLHNKVVILVDDGIATGASMRVAVKSIRRQSPKKIIVAAPVAPQEAIEVLGGEVDDLVVLETPEYFGGVGRWYENFQQTEDSEVIALLANSVFMNNDTEVRRVS
jgi:predicted phosphoribosyltransferase